MSWIRQLSSKFNRSTTLQPTQGKKRRRSNSPSLRSETLEDRHMMTGMVLNESTFDPTVFGDNMHSFLDFNTVGYAYAVNHDGVSVAAQGSGGLYGASSGVARTAADLLAAVFSTTTRTEVASVSKIITTAAVLQLLDRQTNDLDTALSTPITEFLPSDWPVGPNVELITVRHLLTHTSGFQEGGPTDPMNLIGVNFEVFDNNDFGFLRDLVETGHPNFGVNANPPMQTLPTGEPSWSRIYSNANFSLLAKMIPYMRDDIPDDVLDDIAVFPLIDPDDLFGVAYKQYVQDNILTPAGVINPDMTPSGDASAMGYNLATTVASNEGSPGYSQEDWTELGGAFGWKLSAPELARFLHAIQHDASILSPTVRDLMNSEDLLLGWNPGANSGSNPVNLSPPQDAFGAYYSHNGGADGAGGAFRSRVVVFPGDIEAALVINDDASGLPASQSNIMQQSYINAWTDLFVEGSESNDQFEFRLNSTTTQPSLDLFVNGDLQFTHWVGTLESLTLSGLGGNDTFIIEDLPGTVDLVINGHGHDDMVTFGDGDVDTNTRGNMTFHGGGGDDSLWYFDTFDSAADSYTITSTSVDKSSSPGTILYDSISRLELRANRSGNRIDIEGTSEAAVTVHGAQGADAINVLGSDIGGSVTVHPGTGGDGVGNVITVGGLKPQFSGTHEKSPIEGNVDSAQSLITVLGATELDELYILDASSNDSKTVTVTNSTIGMGQGDNFFPKGGGLVYDHIALLRMYLGNGDEHVAMHSTYKDTLTEIYAGEGNDAFTLQSPGNTVNLIQGQLNIDGQDGHDQAWLGDVAESADTTVTVTNQTVGAAVGDDYFGGSGQLSYDAIEELTIQTGHGADHINVRSTATGAATEINAGDGFDRIMISSNNNGTGTLNEISSQLTIDGAEDGNLVQLYDHSDMSSDQVTITSTHIGAEVGDDAFGPGGFVEYSNIANIDYVATQASDDIRIRSVSPDATVAVSASSGNDLIRVSSTADEATGVVDGVQGVLSLEGGSGTNTLVLSDASNSTDKTVTVEPTGPDQGDIGQAPGDNFFAAGGGLSYLQFAEVILDMGVGADAINFAPSPTTTGTEFILDGNDPDFGNPTPQDHLYFDFTGVVDPTVSVIQLGAATVSSTTHSEMKYSNIEHIDVIAGPGYELTGNISDVYGASFNDMNGDGIRDVDEPPMEGVKVFLDTNGNGLHDGNEPHTLTDVNGAYEFLALPAGDYAVGQTTPMNYSQTTPKALNNPGFETGDLDGWKAKGNLAALDSTSSGPTEGLFVAAMDNDGNSSNSLENSLDVPSGSLDALAGPGNAITQGSAMTQTITVEEGATLVFDFDFFTREQADSQNRNDYAFLTVGSELFKLADTFSPLVSTSPASTYSWHTDFGTVTHSFPVAGTYTIGMGVVNVNSDTNKSALLIDNVRLSSGVGMHYVSAGGGTTITGLDFGNHEIASTAESGNFDGSDSVGSSDLNLVLFYWGVDGSDLPDSWVHHRPAAGTIVGVDQLNAVLFNWGVDGFVGSKTEPAFVDSVADQSNAVVSSFVQTADGSLDESEWDDLVDVALADALV